MPPHDLYSGLRCSVFEVFGKLPVQLHDIQVRLETLAGGGRWVRVVAARSRVRLSCPLAATGTTARTLHNVEGPAGKREGGSTQLGGCNWKMRIWNAHPFTES